MTIITQGFAFTYVLTAALYKIGIVCAPVCHSKFGSNGKVSVCLNSRRVACTLHSEMSTPMPYLHIDRRLTAITFLLITSLTVAPSARGQAVAPPSNEESPSAIQPSSKQTQQFPSFAGIAQTAMPAVVNIATTQKTKVLEREAPFHPPQQGPPPFGDQETLEEFFRRFFGERQLPPRRQRGLGSGFIISTDGYIVTNNHVIDGADTVAMRLSGKEEYKATVIGTDDKTDLALLKINAPRPLPTVPLGSSSLYR